MASKRFDFGLWLAFAAVFALGVSVALFASYYYYTSIAPLSFSNASVQASALPPMPFSNEVLTASTTVLAVRGDTNTGVASTVSTEIRAGKGRVLINTNPFVEPDTQQSAETAVGIAQEIVGKGLGERDVIFTFGNESNLVGGPSAGAAMTVITVAALEKKSVRRDTAITGTIEEDGSVGLIGGVLEKAEAAAKNGVTLFLVPKQLVNLSYYEPHVTQRRFGNFVIQEVTYVTKRLDLSNYTKTQWGMETRGVEKVEEAVELMVAS